MLAHVDNRITYSGNGNATEFAYQFKILDRTDIKVMLTDADGKEKLLTKDYYVDVEKNVVRYPGYAVGAEVPESERPPALPTGWKLTIYREVPVTQETDLPDQYPFNQVEAIGDKLTMIAQQLTDTTDRSLKIGVSKSTDIDTVIPWENGKSFRISDDGKKLELSEDPAKVLPLAQGVYAQTQAQAQSAAASATAAAKSEDSAFESAGVAGNSAQYASLYAASAAENAELTSGYKQEALTAKADATASATNAKASEANAKISENNAEASKEAAQSAATTASNFASAARNSANEAQTYSNNAKTYMDNAKNYSENVNVFVPSVSTEGVLSWTNKAGLTNPKSVNIKGAKGDTGTAASIKIGSVTTGAAGSNASVTNSGTASNVVLDFTLPRGDRGEDGADSGIVVDTALSATSTNPVQNKVIKAELDKKTAKTDKIYEANLEWGDSDLLNSFSPIDAAMVPELGSDHFCFFPPSNVDIEYSIDGGKTWLDYGLTIDQKWKLFSQEADYAIGKCTSNNQSTDNLLRITMRAAGVIYTQIKKFIFYISTNGSHQSYVTIETQKDGSDFKAYGGKHYLAGWSGYTVVNFEIIREQSIAGDFRFGTTHYCNADTIRFTFGHEGFADNNPYKGLTVKRIMAFGGTCWAAPSNMARHGHLYKYNELQEAKFPSNVTAPNFIGKVNGFTIESSVPTNAKFIDNETSNTWTGQQTFIKAIFKDIMLVKALIKQEVYQSEYINGTAITPTRSTMCLTATGATTLDMTTIVTECLGNNRNSTVFTAYITSDADYTLTITNAGTIKYIGSASDVAITSAGLLLNIWMSKDGGGTLTSIVQANKLGGAV